MSFNVDVLATDDVGMVLDVSLEVHVDTTTVGVVELAIAGEGTFHKSREHDNICTCRHTCQVFSCFPPLKIWQCFTEHNNVSL